MKHLIQHQNKRIFKTECWSKYSVSKLVDWQMNYMIFGIMFREFCDWLSYLEYEQ